MDSIYSLLGLLIVLAEFNLAEAREEDVDEEGTTGEGGQGASLEAVSRLPTVASRFGGLLAKQSGSFAGLPLFLFSPRDFERTSDVASSCPVLYFIPVACLQ